MKKCKNWYIKVQEPVTKYIITVYEDGRIYGNEEGQKICLLKDAAIDEIRALVHEDITFIKNDGYYRQNKDGLTVRFWDDSRRKQELKVKGWRSAEEVVRIILVEDNFKKLFIDDEELISIAEAFYGITSEECSDEK